MPLAPHVAAGPAGDVARRTFQSPPPWGGNSAMYARRNRQTMLGVSQGWARSPAARRRQSAAPRRVPGRRRIRTPSRSSSQTASSSRSSAARRLAALRSRWTTPWACIRPRSWPSRTAQREASRRRWLAGRLGQPPSEEVEVLASGDPRGGQVTRRREPAAARHAGGQRPRGGDAAGQQGPAQLPTAAGRTAAKPPTQRFPPTPRAELLVGHLHGRPGQGQLGLDQQALVADLHRPVEVPPKQRFGVLQEAEQLRLGQGCIAVCHPIGGVDNFLGGIIAHRRLEFTGRRRGAPQHIFWPDEIVRRSSKCYTETLGTGGTSANRWEGWNRLRSATPPGTELEEVDDAWTTLFCAGAVAWRHPILGLGRRKGDQVPRWRQAVDLQRQSPGTEDRPLQGVLPQQQAEDPGGLSPRQASGHAQAV